MWHLLALFIVKVSTQASDTECGSAPNELEKIRERESAVFIIYQPRIIGKCELKRKAICILETESKLNCTVDSSVLSCLCTCSTFIIFIKEKMNW